MAVSIFQSKSDYCDWQIVCFLTSSLFIRIFWESKQFEGKTEMVEPWYGTAYSIENINESIIQVRCLILNIIWFIILVIITVVNVLGGKWLLEWDGGWGCRVSLLVHGYDFQEGKVHIILECMLFILSHIQWKWLNKFWWLEQLEGRNWWVFKILICFQDWILSAPKENLHLPAPNVFVPTDLSLKDTQEVWGFFFPHLYSKIYCDVFSLKQLFFVTGQIPSSVEKVILFNIVVQAWHNVLYTQGIC